MKFNIVIDFWKKDTKFFLTLSVYFTECYIQILRLEFYNFTQKSLGKVILRNIKQDYAIFLFSISISMKSIIF